MRNRLFQIAAAVALAMIAATCPAVRSDDAAKTHPRQILLIRHAEKPDGETSPDLSPRGKERANKLPELFKKSATRPHPFTTPEFIFATKDSKNSHRPVETVTPLAKSLGLTIDSKYEDKEFGKLADHLLKDKSVVNKTVLVCWHHGTLPELAVALGATDAPKKWDSNVFDRVWQLTYDEKGKVTYMDLPQHLLSGDSDK